MAQDHGKNRAKLLEKIKVLLGQIDDVIAQENVEPDNGQSFTPAELRNIAEELHRAVAKEPEPITNEEKKERRERKKQIKQLEEHADKLDEYDRKLETMVDRNSYSKTDQSATFMRMKEDAMNNGRTKPGYNLQIGTEGQFITDFGFFQTPGDTFTIIPFYHPYFKRYGRFPQTGVADAGYGSEENFRFMDEAGIDAYVKYNMFHKEQRMHYKPNPFSPQAMFYNAEEDYYVCPMGQHLTRTGTTKSKTESGYVTESAQYKARRCQGCPLRGSCFKAKGDWTIEVNHRHNEYRRRARERLTSEEGIRHRGQRCIEPEAVFGQMKYNMAYKRFRHFGLDKVKMDFAFFAIAFNLNKMCSNISESAKTGNDGPCFGRFGFIARILFSENPIFFENDKNSVA